MKSVLAIALLLISMLTMVNGGAQVFNPTGGIPAPGNAGADHPLIKAYVIELKYLSPEQAVQMLQGEGSRFKAFIPKEITEINALPNSQKLLIQTMDAQAAVRLTQLISLIDQPGRLGLQAMLVIVPSDGTIRGEKEPILTADGKTPQLTTAVQTWVQSLIDNYRGSVVLFADGLVANNQLITLLPPSFLLDATITIATITPDQSNSNLLFSQPSEQKITARVLVFAGNVRITKSETPEGAPRVNVTASQMSTQMVSMVVDRTTLVPISLPTATEVDHVPVRYILALTPKIIPPAIPDISAIRSGVVVPGRQHPPEADGGLPPSNYNY